jgi:hypothetical protein
MYFCDSVDTVKIVSKFGGKEFCETFLSMPTADLDAFRWDWRIEPLNYL